MSALWPYDQRQANTDELRTATNAATSLGEFLRPGLRTLERHLDEARAGRELSQLRVALSTRLEARYGARVRSLPSTSTVPDHLFVLRSHVDSLDGLIAVARNDFSRAVPLPDGWDPSIAVQVQPARRRVQHRFGR
ncbi:hypothetical protein [Streptomyces sp. NPDC101234]|uniref:hypothetical protein n=1 Tax=Streptomyces sp. NPDC101234 TaxID=3366138 RepID=UPI003806D42C